MKPRRNFSANLLSLPFATAIAALLGWSPANAQTSFTGTATTAWNAARWNNAANGPTYTSTFTANNAVNFTTGTYNIAGMGAAINVGNVTLSDNVTVNFTAASSTYATGGLVRTINVGTNSTYNMSTQAVSTAAGAGFLKSGAGTWVTAGGAYAGGFTLDAGTVALAGSLGMGDGGALTINGGTIRSNSTTARDLSDRYDLGITIGGNFTLGDTTNNGALTFTNNVNLGAANRTITVNSSATFGSTSVFSGASGVGFTKNGTGQLRLNGANTFTGSVEVSNGILQIGNYDGLDTVSSLTVSGGGTSNLQLIAAAGTTANSINKTLSLHGALSTAGGVSGDLLTQTMVGNITLAGTSSINSHGQGRFDIDGQIDLGAHSLTYLSSSAGNRIDGNIIGSGGSLTKTGTLDLTLAGANSYTGATTITSGTLTMASLGVFGTTPGVNGTSGITIGSASAATLSTSLNGIVIAAPITTADTGITSTIAFGRASSDAGSLTLNGAIGGNGHVIFTTPNVASNGNLQSIRLGTAATYAGNTTLSAGNVANSMSVVNTSGAADVLPTTTVLSFSTNSGNGNGRTTTFDLNGQDQTLAGLNFAANVPNDRNFRVNSTNAATLTINNATNYSFGGANIDVGASTPGTLTSAQITGAIALTKSGAGTFTLGGNLTNGAAAQGNTFTGDTNITQGILVLGESVSIRNSAFDTTSIAGTVGDGLRVGIGGAGVTTLTLGGLKGGNNFSTRFTTTTGGYTNLTALTLNPGTGVTHSYAGDIGDGATGMNLSKTGAGTQILTGTNTHTGTTTVSAGVLAVNGTLANTSTTTVSGTGTLKGGGSIANSVTIASGGTLASGTSIESFTTGALSFTNGSNFEYELDKDVAATAAGDLTAVTGNLTLTGTVTLNLLETGIGAWELGNPLGDHFGITPADKLTLISYTGTWNGGLFTYLGNTVLDDSYLILNGQQWLFNYNDTDAGTNFTGDLGGATGFVTMTVPEPGAALLGGLGLLALLRRRR